MSLDRIRDRILTRRHSIDLVARAYNVTPAALGYTGPADDERLLNALDAVLAVHEPIDALMYTPRGQHHKKQVCTGCGQDDGNWNRWPCPTVKAVTEAVGES